VNTLAIALESFAKPMKHTLVHFSTFYCLQILCFFVHIFSVFARITLKKGLDTSVQKLCIAPKQNIFSETKHNTNITTTLC